MFTVCPQGFINSGFFLQQALQKTLGDLKNVIFFADDILIFSTESEEDNIKTVVEVLERLKKKDSRCHQRKYN